MPAIANYTIKKADGTTDIVWTGMLGAAGDKTPAIWRSNTVGLSVAHRPEMKYWAYNTPSSSHRVQRVTTVFPVTYVENGITKVLGYSSFSSEYKSLISAPDSDVAEFAAQTVGSQSAIKAFLVSGFPPN